jgi:hypothetical protein
MRRWAYFLLLSAIALPAGAQTDEDSPGQGVARISVINGEVSVRRGDSGDLVAAAINAPLVVSDHLSTGPASRAEVQFDYANMIRLGAETEVRFTDLEYKRYQVQVAVGTVTFRVLRNTDADVEISTPSVSVRPAKRGVYRVTVKEDGSSEITVRNGEAEVFTPRGSERLRAGQTMLARGSSSDPEFQIVAGIPYDSWDRWNEDRDRDLERSRSYQYVSSDIYGAEDLDPYGRWVYAAPYGYVWAPTVAAGWAPYRYGRWSWMDYYGWSWISYDPWGWAPYHYGRWFYSSPYGWCWWPGGGGRHYWRPALVAFFGWGNYGGFRAGIGFGWGNIGWVPLAPYETFYPWYGRRWYGGYRGGTYINNTVIVNNTNVYGSYRNARIANGITGVNSDIFGRRGITNADILQADQAHLRNAGLVRGVLPLTPDRSSLRLADRQVQTAGLPRVAENRTFFSSRRGGSGSPGIERVSFDRQRQTMEQVARRTFSNGSDSPGGAGVREAAGAPGRDVPAGGGEAGRGGWRRVNEGTAGNEVRGGGLRTADSPARVQNESGAWRRAGEPAQAGGTPGRQVMTPGGGVSQPENSRGDWRRFGSAPAGRTESMTSPRVDTAPGRTEGPMDRQPADRGNVRAPSDWRRFGDPGGRQVQTQPRVERPAPSMERSAPSVDRQPRSAPSMERMGPGGGGRAEPSARPSTRDRSDNSTWQRFGDTSGGASSRSFGVDRGSQNSFNDGGRQSQRMNEPVRISPPIVRERPSMESQSGRSRFGGGGGSFGDSRMSMPRSEPRSWGGSGGMSAPRMGGGGSFGGGARMSGGSFGGGGGRSFGGGGGGGARMSGGGGGGGGRMGGGGGGHRR